MIQQAKISDIKQIQELEKMYYDGYFISESILAQWIKNRYFFLIEEDSKIVGSIYFEFLDEIKDLPWEHPSIKNKTGKYVYISEISIDFPERINELFAKIVKTAKDANCAAIIWLTGEKAKHDRIEQKFLEQNGFKVYKKVDNWECSPKYFIHDHSLWIKELK